MKKVLAILVVIAILLLLADPPKEGGWLPNLPRIGIVLGGDQTGISLSWEGREWMEETEENENALAVANAPNSLSPSQPTQPNQPKGVKGTPSPNPTGGRFEGIENLNSPTRTGCQKGNLNWGWPTLVEAAKERSVPPLTLAFLWYVESGCARKNPGSTGAFQNHYVKGVIPKAEISLEELKRQAMAAADHLQRTGEGRISLNTPLLDSFLVQQVYEYNGTGYGSVQNSPYVYGYPGAIMDLYVRSGVKAKNQVIKFYGYVPFVKKVAPMLKD